MKKKYFYLFCSLVIFIIAVTACSKKEKSKTPQPQTEQQAQQQEPKPHEVKPLFSTHGTTTPGASKTTVEPSPDAKADTKDTATAIPAKQVAQPEKKASGVNPLDLYDFEVTVEKVEQYSPTVPEKGVAYWRVINSMVKTKDDNLKQAQVVLKQMKRKYPDAYIYNMDINERYYSVPSKIGQIIPYTDQLQGNTNY